MDNDFKQQFIQKVKASSNLESNPSSLTTPTADPSTSSLHTSPVPPTIKEKTNKTPLILLGILSAIELLIIIVLVFKLSTLSNQSTYLSIDDETIEDADDDALYNENTNSKYIFENENLIAFDLTCNQDETNYFTFSTDNTYTEKDTSFGTYSIIHNSIIHITDSTGDSRTLYYDGFILADDVDIYHCL